MTREVTPAEERVLRAALAERRARCRYYDDRVEGEERRRRGCAWGRAVDRLDRAGDALLREREGK